MKTELGVEDMAGGTGAKPAEFEGQKAGAVTYRGIVWHRDQHRSPRGHLSRLKSCLDRVFTSRPWQVTQPLSV